MNSRDAAYDDEQLRRAIEASKEEVAQDGTENTIRRTKRGRSNSEEYLNHNLEKFCFLGIANPAGRNNVIVKRQRTNSQSTTPPPKPMDTISQENTDDESGGRNGLKRPRTYKLTERSEREEKDRLRQETISKRKGRADRRRTEGELRVVVERWHRH